MRDSPGACRGFNEAALQRLWFEHALPRRLTTSDGQRVEIVQTGWWNREGGADFRDAAVRFAERVLRHGDIELHLDAGDWVRHGHHRDPAYNGVVLHVALAGSAPARLECGALIPTVELGSQLAESAGVLMARLPPRAWTGSERVAHPGACAARLSGLAPGAVRGLLREAGRHRLSLKASRLARQWRRDGPMQTLWEAVAEGLGYRENQVAFRLLARKARARPATKMSSIGREAWLFGLAGFLPRFEVASWRGEGRDHAMVLWREWWTMAGSPGTAPVPDHLWQRGRCRPANHPHRRVGALAAVGGALRRLLAALKRGDLEGFTLGLVGLRHEYFERHAALGSEPAPARLALIGESRVRDLVVNVAAPWILAQRGGSAPALEALPASQPNRLLRIAAERLLGGGAGAFRPACALEQQGLLHIYHGFCATDATDCGACPMPDIVAGWAGGESRPVGRVDGPAGGEGFPRPEKGGADPHQGTALLDGDRKVTAHAHGKLG